MKTLAALLTTVVVVSSSVARAELVLTMGGDINFNKDEQTTEAGGVRLGGTLVPFSSFTKNIKPLLNGDINFGNLETVLTDRRDIRAADKQYQFRSHPNAVKHLLDIGFNLFSLANNHTYDFGTEGMRETWRHLRELQKSFPAMEFQGGGENRAEATTPVIFRSNGYTIAFASIGIMDSNAPHATDRSPGVLNIRDDRDLNLVLKKMKEAKADLKILAMHFGKEAQITLDPGQRARYHKVIEEGDVDIIIGHHPHVVRPIEMIQGKLIIYSLGNYLMPGAANLDGRPAGYNYGLFARVYFDTDATTGRLKAQATEIIPLKTMHARPTPIEPKTAGSLVSTLNSLSRSQVGDRAVKFSVRKDGSGLACAGPGTNYGAKASVICK